MKQGIVKINYIEKCVVVKKAVILLYGIEISVKGYLKKQEFDKLTKYLKRKGYRYSIMHRCWYKVFNDPHALQYALNELTIFLEENNIRYTVWIEGVDKDTLTNYI